MVSPRKLAYALLMTGSLATWSSGCVRKNYCEEMGCYEPTPNGTISDEIWKRQESNAEASDFVIHEHEFVGNTVRLNKGGEDHLKSIAARAANVPFPILVEPSSMSPRPNTKFKLPIHNDPQLDLKRRELIVQTLESMGVADAETRVIVSPALVPGFEGFEAQNAFQNGFSGRGNGFGGGFGGGGFGGGGGGFGGGF